MRVHSPLAQHLFAFVLPHLKSVPFLLTLTSTVVIVISDGPGLPLMHFVGEEYFKLPVQIRVTALLANSAEIGTSSKWRIRAIAETNMAR